MIRTAVIVPSYNRPERLRGCLTALVAQDRPADEIIVVDDGSDRPLAVVCESFGPLVRCLRQVNRGPAAARNAGVHAAKAGFVAFTDDDCHPQPGWLSGLIAAQDGAADRLVGGRVENALSRNVYAAASQSLCDYLYDYYGAVDGEAPFFTSNNMGCARATFERMGGFDESFPLAAAEDRDFGLRWRASGGTLAYAPQAVVDHSHALDLHRFWRQHANYGRGARHLHRVMDQRGDARPKLEALRFYFGLVSHPMRTGGAGAAGQSLLMVASQLAMVHGYVAQSWAERRTTRILGT